MELLLLSLWQWAMEKTLESEEIQCVFSKNKHIKVLVQTSNVWSLLRTIVRLIIIDG